MKLLIVENAELIRNRLVEWIQRLPGVELSVADGVEGALHSALHNPPEMVVLDLQLSDGDGIRVVPWLKIVREDVRIAVLTNDASAFNRTRCLKAGADWFFDKSNEFEQLLALVQEESAKKH